MSQGLIIVTTNHNRPLVHVFDCVAGSTRCRM
jgi:hypothetical protein